MSIPCPDPQDRPLTVPEKRPEAPKPALPDTYTEVSPGIWRNNRTGFMETPLPLPPLIVGPLP